MTGSFLNKRWHEEKVVLQLKNTREMFKYEEKNEVCMEIVVLYDYLLRSTKNVNHIWFECKLFYISVSTDGCTFWTWTMPYFTNDSVHNL